MDNEEYSFLNATDSDPIPVRYISFCSWGASLSKWFYDCHRPGDGSDIQEVVMNLTAAERIYAHLFQSYDQTVSPEGLTRIDLQMEIIRTAYSTAQSSLTTRGILRMVCIMLYAGREDYLNLKKISFYLCTPITPITPITYNETFLK